MKKFLIDFSKVLSPIGISRFIAENLSPYLSLSEQEIREKYKSHITDLVLGKYRIQSLVQEYLPFLSSAYDGLFLYQKFLEIPPINSDFITFLEKQKQTHPIQYYLVSDLYPELGEQLKTQF
ncbi:MAG: hypothetical protein LBG52_02400 [Candidatus Peribacteria bacterium]|jgi:hypothetical protein|nr:hypothetical protein [Candidatus Peribacteria bacterium]